jgi:hypothetical protein
MTNELQNTFKDGEIYGGLLLNIQESGSFKPIEFPFEGEHVARGNHVKSHSNMVLSNFDYWHADNNAERNTIYVAERGIGIDGRMVGHNTESMLRSTIHRVLTVNNGIKPEDRVNMLDTVTNTVFPTIQSPAFISLTIQSSQPKFILFSRDIPIHISVFCDEDSMVMVWTNEHDLDKRMREVYKDRFAVFRMQPIVNSVVVLQSFFLKKKLNRWKHEMRDRIRLLNALEAMIIRRSKSDADTQEKDGQTA